jgi:HlyD family secretion protein
VSAQTPELKPGQTRKEVEGVFVFRNNEAIFLPVKVGIAGEKYFEVMSGLKDGDQVITGPFNSVRNLKDGDEVKVGPPPGAPKP